MLTCAVVRATTSFAAALLFILILGGARPAYADLDPGNGSMLLQIVLGGAAGLAVMARLAWNRILGRFSGRPSTPASDKPEPTAPEPAGDR